MANTHEQRAKKLRSQVNAALIVLLQTLERVRPRLVIGEGQGGVVVGMSTFPAILERACRDRAVTQQQMVTFRQALSGVTGFLVIDPVILPTSNNRRTIPLELLKDSFPAMTWLQPRSNRRAMLTTRGYLTGVFAEEFATYMGCVAERELPQPEFVEEAIRPPPLCFETDEQGFQGVCCVCYKKGCLGRCPNPSCGLLMHHTCVTPPGPGEELQCPICKSEVKLEEARASSSIPPRESAGSDLPYWHEVGIGAPATTRKGRAGSKPLPPQERRAPFPQDRWPSEEEADLHGFRSVKDLSLIHI